jgi:hypothetical protein
MISATQVRVLAAALLAAVAWFAVVLQLWLSIQLGFTNGKSLADGLVAFFGYFTVLTNFFVALVATAGAFSRTQAAFQWLYRPSVVGCATTAILLVGIVYHLLLREIWSPQGAQLLADVLLHYVVPAGALLHWLVYQQQERLTARSPLGWCLYPLAYVSYALIRGKLLGSYPYPFIDVASLGYQQVLVNTTGFVAAFIALGFVVLGLDRLVAKTVRYERQL